MEFGASRAFLLSLCTIILMCALVACRPDMMNQPRAKPFSESQFFKDETNARALPVHAVAHEQDGEDEAFHEQLPREPPLRRAERQPYAQLVAARRRASQLQVRDVCGGNQENQRYDDEDGDERSLVPRADGLGRVGACFGPIR